MQALQEHNVNVHACIKIMRMS